MKIFFTASQRGKKTYQTFYDRIAQTIKKEGFSLLDDDILTQSSESFYKQMETGGRKALIDFYNTELDRIQKADINVFDCSFGSLSIGYIVEKSLEYNKPTLILYYKDNVPFFLGGSRDEKLMLGSYNEKNLEQVVKDVLKRANDLRDKRFNFFISPRLLSYIESASKKIGVTKSVFIRNLIIDHQRKNANK